ncbi:MscS mechanosensitive ion channel [Pseudomonas amygdali pv. lachrymans]|uniref:MscS mechanosensitive ion channel n=1 Tax=Pseudomonas amygdali pv. lachrymans TaxID=53707 RepID=A0A0P9T7W8_PSEAV|nr:MscS mechanosensitive ion channel [Pseudomonas amygdali pv. lachrymans]
MPPVKTTSSRPPAFPFNVRLRSSGHLPGEPCPAVDVHLSSTIADSITLSVRPYCHNNHYDSVHRQTLALIRALMLNMS